MRLGFYYTLSVPYAAGFACFGSGQIGGFNLTGWVFAIMLAAAPAVFILDRRQGHFPFFIWLPWLLMVPLSLAWAEQVDLSAVQEVCQIMTPFVIAPIASKAVTSTHELNALLRGYFHCLLILLAGLALHVTFGVGILLRPMAMTAAVTGCVFVAQVQQRPLYSILGWGGCLLIAATTGGRMATFAVLMLWLVLPGYRRRITRALVAGAVVVIAVSLFYTSLFQARFFIEDRGTLGDVYRGNFFSSGRFEAWPELWDEVRRRPLLGAGAHASAEIVARAWEDMSHPHNDYLRILLDQGFVGLTFFLFGVAGQVASLWNRRPTARGRTTVVPSAALMGLCVLILTAMTDNAIIYGVWFMHPLFVLVGASYAQVSVKRDSQTVAR